VYAFDLLGTLPSCPWKSLPKKVSSLLPSNRNRSALVHSLASALGLFKGGEGNPLYTLKPERATPEELRLYHDQDYIGSHFRLNLPQWPFANAHFPSFSQDFVLRYDKTNGNSSKSSPDSGSSDSAAVAEFGLQDVGSFLHMNKSPPHPFEKQDCPLFRGLSSYVPLVGGASLTACRVLRDGRANVAIVWDGGRHHARKSHASGFCYVADCVLSILSLKRPTSPNSPRPRIMYLDLDLHFADAVSEAFSSTSSSASSVLTLSIHHAAPGFFPASSRASLTSATSSDLYNLSIPLSRGASCETFHRIWESAVELVKDAFDPEYVILQCGVDGLAGDPCAIWNWEIDVEKEGSLGWCVKKVMSWKRKTLVLGGGASSCGRYFALCGIS
jgi:histone deacetylase 8